MPPVHSCSDLIAFVSLSWFTEALKAVSGSHTHDVPKMSPTYKRHWLTRLFPQLGETAIDSIKEQHQTFESLDTNLNVAGDSQVWNRASEMCMELQPHFTKEDFLQQSGIGPRANTASMVSQQAFIVHRSVRLLFPDFWANGACTQGVESDT